MEANLLRAFHDYGEGQTARLHATEITAQDLGTRFPALEDRMLNVENRRPNNPDVERRRRSTHCPDRLQ